MENVQKRVQDAVNVQIEDLDRNYMRKMQAAMHRCAAACCENPAYKADDVQRCTERCSGGLNQSYSHMQNELESFQNRLQRCAMDCQDKIRDRLGSSPTEADVMKHRPEMESCVVKCADTHIALIPQMFDRVKDVIRKHQKS